MTPFTRIARAQHGVITYEQLLATGLSREAIRHLVRTGRLRRVHRGVYALEGPLGPEGIAMAAVLRCQPRSLADRLTAAAILGLRERWPGRPQVVTARRSNGRAPAGVDLRRSRTLTRADATQHRGIPVTSVTRTLRDCTPLLGDRDLKALVRQAERLHRIDIAELDGPPKLRRVLSRYVARSGFTANDMEARFLELCVAAGVPLPERQAVLGPYRVDFVWPQLGLVVETDGRGSRAIAIAFTDDRVRDRRLAIAGFTVLRFTWAEIEFAPATVVADLIAAVAARTDALGR